VRPIVLFLLTALAVGGCATHRPTSIADQFVRRGEPSVRLGDGADRDRPAEESLATFIEKVRQLSMAMRPAPAGTATIVETSNRELAEALAREAAHPTAETHRTVGEIYARLGVLDLAYGRFALAIKTDGRDAAAYDQMARVWRDWGFPNLGLGDAYRAVYYAPRSPSASNTLGTLLQALGQPAPALNAYRRTLALEPDAAYALNNVCSALLDMQKPDEALAACQRAVQLDPTLLVAQRNLAAVVAARADFPGARPVVSGQTSVGSGLPPAVAPAPVVHRVDELAARLATDRSRPTGHARTSVTADLDRR